MIKRTLIVFVVLFSTYAIYRDVIKPDMLVSQEQWQDNQIKAQEFLYSDSVYENIVIVGSSMPVRLIMDSLPSNVINLALGGESSLEGLEMLKRKKYTPRYIFIETNTLYKRRTEFEDVLYNPILFTVRNYLPVLRDGKQPLPLIKNYVESNIVQKVIPYQFSFASKKKTTENRNKPNIQNEQNSNNQQTKRIAELQKARTLNNQSILKAYVSYFEEKGVEIILYEMPQKISNLNLALDARMATYEVCPESKYRYIFVDWADYATSDGVHLTKESALKYTLFLRKQIEELPQ